MYESRDQAGPPDSARARYNAFVARRTADWYDQALSRAGMLPLGRRDILDLGCGGGWFLMGCRDHWGAQGARHAGVDLVPGRIEALRQQCPALELHACSADALPLDDGGFDLIHQSMMFSSIPDEGIRQRIASEIRRVLRPGGRLLWYDYIWNPVNRAMQGLPLRKVLRLFPGWRKVVRLHIHPMPPLARLLVRLRCGGLIPWIERLGVLNAFELLVLEKP